MSAGRVALACGVAVVVTVATAWMSRTPVTFGDESQALLRLSWRVRGAEVETCRTRSAEELEALPVHMRTDEVCVGAAVPYLLHVEVDGERVADDTVSASGARSDRPISVLVDVPVTPARHEVSVAFSALVPTGAELPAESVRELRWSGVVEWNPRDLVLVTFDPGAGRLEVRTPPGG